MMFFQSLKVKSLASAITSVNNTLARGPTPVKSGVSELLRLLYNQGFRLSISRRWTHLAT